MAKITKFNIKDPKTIVLEEERGLETRGRFEINKLVRDVYIEKEYDKAPTAPPPPFNGMQVSIAELNHKSMELYLARTFYFFCKAMRTIYKTNPTNLSPEELREISPKIVHISMKSLLEVDGRLYVLGHLRGDGSYGTGQIQSLLPAGGVNPKHLKHENPLLAALVDETVEETGVDLNLFNPNYKFDLIEEEDVGRVNMSMYARGLNLDFLLDNIGRNNKAIKEKGKKTEISGMALTPFDQLLISNIFNGESFERILCYVFDKDNPKKYQETNYKEFSEKQGLTEFLRPPTVAVFDAIVNMPGYMKHFREQSDL